MHSLCARPPPSPLAANLHPTVCGLSSQRSQTSAAMDGTTTATTTTTTTKQPAASAAPADARDASAKKGRRAKRSEANDDSSKKRRCISSACVPCRKRKSKVRKQHGAGELLLPGLLSVRPCPFARVPLPLSLFLCPSPLSPPTPPSPLTHGTVRWDHASLLGLRCRLQHRVHLRPQLGPPPQGRLQKGPRQPKEQQLDPADAHPGHPQLPRGRCRRPGPPDTHL